IVLCRIAPPGVRLSQIGSRQNFDTASFPNRYRGLYTSTQFRDIEPKKEASRRLIISRHCTELFRRRLEFLAIERAAFFHMSLVPPKRRRGILNGQRHLRRRDIAVFQIVLKEGGIARDEARPQTRRVGPLGERIERENALEPAEARRNLKNAGRGRLPVDLGIAFVRKNIEAVLVCEPDKLLEISLRSHDALGICGRGQINGCGAVEESGLERVEGGEKPRVCARGQEDGFDPGRERGRIIGLIEWIWHQHSGTARALARNCDRQRRDEPLPCSAKRQNVPVRVRNSRWQTVTAFEPCRDGAPKLWNAA